MTAVFFGVAPLDDHPSSCSWMGFAMRLGWESHHHALRVTNWAAIHNTRLRLRKANTVLSYPVDPEAFGSR